MNNKIDPKSKFTTQELNSLKRIIDDTIKNMTSQKSYFKLNQVLKSALKEAKKERSFMTNNYLNDVVGLLIDELAENQERLLNIERDKQNKNGNYTTTDLLKDETKTISLATSLSDEYAVNKDIVEKHLATMPLISAEQREAVYHVCYSDKMVSIYQGLAGAGKSFTSKAIKASFQDRNFDIKGIALSWNAADVLAASASIDDCQAIEAFCRSYAKAAQQKTCMFEKDTLIIVDEAGLVGTRHMVQILEAAQDAKKNHGRVVKVVLTGDALQLLPVNAGGMFKTLERHLGSATIGTIRRQVQESQRKMVRYSSERRSGNALYTMIQQENIVWGTNHETTTNQLIRDFLSYKVANPNDSALILALNNNHVIEMNNRVRDAYKKLGFLSGVEIETTVTDGRNKAWRCHFAAGDEVVIRANYRDTPLYKIPEDKDNFDVDSYQQLKMGVFNRNKGKVVKIKESNNPVGSWDIYIDTSGDVTGRMIINTERHLDGNALPMHHNYATTIYASQGQTVKQVYMLYDPNIHFRLFYVGISRHTDNCTMYLNENLLHKQLDADGGKKIINFDEKGNEVLTELGRYSRFDMLKNVAKNCGKDQQNETSLDYMHRITNPEGKKINETELYEIKPANNEDDLMDFDNNYYIIDSEVAQSIESVNKWWQKLYFTQKTVFESKKEKIDAYQKDADEMNENFQKYKREILKYNNLPEDYILEEGDYIYYKKKVSVKVPTIDMQRLLNESDKGYTQSVIIPEKEVDRTRFKRGIEGFMPVYSEDEEKAYQNAEEKELGIANLSLQDLMNQIDNMAKGNGIEEKINNDVLSEETEEKALNKVAKTSQKLFKGLFKTKEKIDLEKKEEDSNEEEKDFKPKIAIPFIKEENPLFGINIKNKLFYLNEDQKLGDENFMEWVNEAAIDEIWHKGKYHEPRFLALDSNGLIREKYDQFGNAKLGTGYPAMLTNPQANDETPVWVVPGVNEWLWSYYFYMKKNYAKFETSEYDNLQDFLDNLSYEEKQNIIKTPEFIWGTKATDYGIVKEYLRGRSLKIVRGKDPKNEEWALNLRKYLWETWYMKTDIHPPFENNEGKYEDPWKNATEEELRIAEGNFRQGDLVREIAKIKK